VSALGEEPIRRPRLPGWPPRPTADRAEQPQQPALPPPPLHPVVVGYSGSASARNALAYAAGMARRLGRPLLVVYLITPGIYCAPLAGHMAGLSDNISALERWLLTELVEVTDSTGLEVHVSVHLGHPAAGLATMASGLSADALVIGAPHRFWRRATGSVPASLTRRARCPVIIVP